MSTILLTHVGYRLTDRVPCLWILSTKYISFYKDEMAFKRNEKPLQTIRIASVNGTNVVVGPQDRYTLKIIEATATTCLCDAYGIVNYWSLAINLTLQGIPKTADELKTLMQGVSPYDRAPTSRQPPPTSGSIPMTREKPKTEARDLRSQLADKSAKRREAAPTNMAREQPPVPSAKVQLAESMLLSCEMESFNQRIMRQACCLEFVNNVLRKTLTIDDLKTDTYFVELFEKLSEKSLNLTTGTNDITVKIHNLAEVIEKTQLLGKVKIPVEAMDIIRGNESAIVSMIVVMFEVFFFKQLCVNKQYGMDGLMIWLNAQLNGTGVELDDFHDTFKDGKAFALIISRRRNDLLDPKFVSTNSSINYSFVRKALEKCRCKIIPDEVFMDDADETSVIMTLSCIMVCLG